MNGRELKTKHVKRIIDIRYIYVHTFPAYSAEFFHWVQWARTSKGFESIVFCYFWLTARDKRATDYLLLKMRLFPGSKSLNNQHACGYRPASVLQILGRGPREHQTKWNYFTVLISAGVRNTREGNVLVPPSLAPGPFPGEGGENGVPSQVLGQGYPLPFSLHITHHNRVFLNFQQHKINKSGNYFFPFTSVVKFVVVTGKFSGWDMLLNFTINNVH